MGKFSGKVVFITGSSKGIGRNVATEMLKAGAKVVINGRNKEALDATASQLANYGSDILKINADVSESAAFEEAIRQIIDRFGKLDILILNAGLSSGGPIMETSDSSLEMIMRVNAFGPFRGARIAIPYIKESRGSIVFISSIAGLHGIPYSAVYSMSKMSLTALAQSLKTELIGTGVHVGIVYVGFTRNDPDKTTVSADGTIKPIKNRPPWIQQKQHRVARLILRSIRWRRFKVSLSPLGKITAFFSRYLPNVWQFFMRGMLKSAKKLA